MRRLLERVDVRVKLCALSGITHHVGAVARIVARLTTFGKKEYAGGVRRPMPVQCSSGKPGKPGPGDG